MQRKRWAAFCLVVVLAAMIVSFGLVRSYAAAETEPGPEAALLPVPEGISFSTTSTSITINWNQVSEALTYDIEADGILISDLNTNAYLHDNLAPNSQHSYRIRSVNAEQTSEWSQAVTAVAIAIPEQLAATATTEAIPEQLAVMALEAEVPPPVPTNLTADIVDGRVELSWEPVDDAQGGMTVENILGDIGNLETRAADYLATGTLNAGASGASVYILSPGDLLTSVDGMKCVDAYFSDYEWPHAPRTHLVRFPTVAGHKYLVYAQAKGTVKLYRINGASGEMTDLGQENSNPARWSPLVYLATGDSNEMIVTYRSAYTTRDLGYVKDFAVIDVSAQGDGDLSAEEIKDKYGALRYTADGQTITAARYQVEIDGSVYKGGMNPGYTQNYALPNTTYTYRVRAVNAGGVSGWSPEVTVTTPDLAAPPAPANLTAHAANGRVELSWEPVDDSQGGMLVGNMLGDIGNMETRGAGYLLTGTLNAGDSGASMYLLYPEDLITSVDGMKCVDAYFSDYGWPAMPRTHLVRFPTVAGHKYLVYAQAKGTVKLYRINGASGEITGLAQENSNPVRWSPLVYLATGDGSEIIIGYRSAYTTRDLGYVKDFAVIDVSTQGDEGLSTEEIKDKYEALRYTADGKTITATRYQVEIDGSVYKGGMNPGYTQIYVLPNTTHTYRVRAVNAGGVSDWSPEITVAVPGLAAPAVPTNLTANAASYWADLSWEPVEDSQGGMPLENILGDIGNMETRGADYGKTGTLNAGDSGASMYILYPEDLITSVDGMKCVDAYFSDYEWPAMPRTHLVRFPTVAGHKYVVYAQAKGTVKLYRINGASGEITDLAQENSNPAGWSPLVYLATGDGSEIIIGYRSAYITKDIGYVKYFIVIDASAQGDEALSDQAIRNKYGQIFYGSGSPVYSQASYQIEVNGNLYNAGYVNSFRLTNLVPATVYHLRIRAQNAGGSSSWSDFIQVETGPPIMQNYPSSGTSEAKSEPTLKPNYQYDDAGRLIHMKNGADSIHFEYDSRGNLLRRWKSQ